MKAEKTKRKSSRVIRDPNPTPDNPNVFRIGKVERRFREMAEDVELTPGELLQALIDEGVTQTKLAEIIDCTRQAVGILGQRYGLDFPGARADLDESVRQHTTCEDFTEYVEMYGGSISQKSMAEMLGTSLSTLKRRIKVLGLDVPRAPKSTLKQV